MLLPPLAGVDPIVSLVWNDQIHINFKKVVVEARGKKIEKARKDDTPDLYDGAVWLAEEAANYGLIDGIGDLHSVRGPSGHHPLHSHMVVFGGARIT